MTTVAPSSVPGRVREPAAQSQRNTAALSVQGMTCMGCVANVTRAIKKVPGVDEVDVNLPRGRATIGFDPEAVKPADVAIALTAAGYPASVEAGEDFSSQQAAEAQRRVHAHMHGSAWKRRAIVGLCIWLPVELTHWVLVLSGHGHEGHINWMTWVGVAAGTFLTVYIGSAFFANAWKAARRGTTDMDTLISLGGGTAYIYSAVALLGHLVLGWPLANLYFMEAAGLFTLISIGHWLEGAARDKAGDAIRALLDLSPATALRLPEKRKGLSLGVSGQAAPDEPTEVPANELVKGDRILIRPGTRIAADGIVETGTSGVDESMLTGEPIPVRKTPGEQVMGGTLNTDGSLVVKITAAGSESALAGIIKLVEQAQASKPPVQKLADRISAIFVPAVLGIAALTATIWLIIGFTAPHLIPSWVASEEARASWGTADTLGLVARATCSVLIIACPCALGLAVPAAIMVGTGRGARRGILMRDIDALQSAQKIDTIIFDKTGTLTTGKPQVTKIERGEPASAGGMDDKELLRIAASIESQSEHPLAQAIFRHAKEQGIDLATIDSFRNEPGLGVEASIEGKTYRVGHAEFAIESSRGFQPLPTNNEASPTGGQRLEASATAEVATAVHIVEQTGAGPQHLGTIYLADQPKPDSKNVVSELRAMGLDIHLLTGDSADPAHAVAQAIGIDAKNVHADVRPGGKKDVVEQLKAQGKTVAMVGDGINDAPALAASDLGIAIGSGTDAAKEAGGIILVGENLHELVAAIRLSRATMTKIKQNLFLAFIYNIIAIPLAAFGILTPMIAAGAMALSDVSVLGNALLLRRTKID